MNVRLPVNRRMPFRLPGCMLLVVAGLWAGAHDLAAADWPRLLGPNHNCTTSEAGLRYPLPAEGLPVLWEMPKGDGFGGPAVVGDRVVVFHRMNEREVIECREARTGAKLWEHSYDAPYHPRYGGGTGPRTSPVIADGRVFTFGIGGQLRALDLQSGKLLWQLDGGKEFRMRPNFFGFGSTPLVMGKLLIAQVGGEIDGDAVNTVALDQESGKLVWSAKHAWGGSYASPVPAKLHGRECVLVLAGGESRPPTGGLLVIDAKEGKVLAAVPHRAGVAESVNAASPVMAGPDRVFVSEAYTAGGLCVAVTESFAARAAWHAPDFGLYWMTPLLREGCIIGFAGMSERNAELVCQDVASGRELWRSELGGGFGRASLLESADGVLCLGEFGDLAWVEISRSGGKVLSRTKLFEAPETWTLPAIANGRLYVCQNQPGRNGTKPRLICYDFQKR